MSNAIDLLERIGQDASLRHAADLASILNDSDSDTATVRAMLAADTSSDLHKILGAKPNVFCGIAPASYEDGADTLLPEQKIS